MVEYACPVWSTNLTKYLSDSIETVQKRALKSIYPAYTYEEILKTVKLPTLSTRRDDLCKKYFNGMKPSKHKLNHLLPETRDVPYLLRSVNKYPLVKLKANTNRYKNSFIPWALKHWQ